MDLFVLCLSDAILGPEGMGLSRERLLLPKYRHNFQFLHRKSCQTRVVKQLALSDLMTDYAYVVVLIYQLRLCLGHVL
jgi:hypothetical protein